MSIVLFFTMKNTQIQAGKVNQGLHVSNSGRFLLGAKANECISYLEKCTKGLSIALWVKPSGMGHRGYGPHVAHGQRSINIVHKLDDRGVRTWAWGQTKEISPISSKSRAFLHTWTHVAVVYDPEVGLSPFLNGTLEAFRSVNEEVPHNRNFQQYTFGSKTNGGFPFNGTLDEIKIFYDSLTSTSRFKPGS